MFKHLNKTKITTTDCHNTDMATELSFYHPR